MYLCWQEGTSGDPKYGYTNMLPYSTWCLISKGETLDRYKAMGYKIQTQEHRSEIKLGDLPNPKFGEGLWHK